MTPHLPVLLKLNIKNPPLCHATAREAVFLFVVFFSVRTIARGGAELFFNSQQLVVFCQSVSA